MTNLKYTDVFKPEDISVAHCWNAFAAMALSGAPDIQRREMRKAFYAGFLECFKITADLSSELPEAQAVPVLERLNKEVVEFYNQFAKENGFA